MNISNKGIVLSILLLSMTVPFSELKAQKKMLVEDKSGSISNYEIYNISKILFSSGNLRINKVSGNPDSYSIQNIKSLTFNELTTKAPVVSNADKQATLIYPNPTSSQFQIELKSVETGTFTVAIFDIQGKMMKSKTFSKSIGINKRTMNMEELNQGLYFCRIQSGLDVENIKIIKN